jgi:integrase
MSDSEFSVLPPYSGNPLPLMDNGNGSNIELYHRQLTYLAAATSDNTRRAYRSAIKHYLDWGGVLPSDEARILHYLVAHAELHNPRTLAMRTTALSQWHVQQGFSDPTATVTVRKTLAGIGRSFGRPKKKAKSLPMDDLELVVASLSRLDSLKALRDSALLQVGFFGGFRRSELVAIMVEHVTWDAYGITITLPRSKTDQSGEGISKAIPYGNGVCCPAKALRAWLDGARVTRGPVFRPISKWGEIGKKGLNAASVSEILASSARLAGLGYALELSSHSLRRGMATSASRAGADFQDIKRQGGWKHDGTVQGYIDEADLYEKNAAATLLNGRKKPPESQ